MVSLSPEFGDEAGYPERRRRSRGKPGIRRPYISSGVGLQQRKEHARKIASQCRLNMIYNLLD
jgi:hypothetical protein